MNDDLPNMPFLASSFLPKPSSICKNCFLLLIGLGLLGFCLSLSPPSLASESKNDATLICLDERYGFYLWITIVRRGNNNPPLTEEQRTLPCGHRLDHPNPWWLWGDTIDDAYLFSLRSRGTLKGSTTLTSTFQVGLPDKPVGQGFLTATVVMEDAVFLSALANLTSTVTFTNPPASTSTKTYTNVLRLSNVFTNIYKLNPNLAEITVTVALTELLKLNDSKVKITVTGVITEPARPHFPRDFISQMNSMSKTYLLLHSKVKLGPILPLVDPNTQKVNPIMIVDFSKLPNGLPEAKIYMNTHDNKNMGNVIIDYKLEGQKLKVNSTGGFPYFTLRISSTSRLSEKFLENNKTPWLVSTTATTSATTPGCLLQKIPWLRPDCKANYNLRSQVDGARLGGEYFFKGTLIDSLPDWRGLVGGETLGTPDWETIVMEKEQDPKPAWAYPRVGIFQRQPDGPLWRATGDEYDTEHELLLPTFPHLDFGNEINWFKANPRPLYFNLLNNRFEQWLFVGFQNAGNLYYNSANLPPNVSFESPFAFYGFDPDPNPATKSRYAQLLVRGTPFSVGDVFAIDNKDVFDASITRSSFRYSWKTLPKSFFWNYALCVAGHQIYTEELKIGEEKLIGVKQAEFPSWVTSKEWPVATFVEAPGDGYGGSEGIYFQSAQAPPLRPYLDSIEDEEPYFFIEPYLMQEPILLPVSDIALPEGFRGENNAEYYWKPEMYYSPIDRKLHLFPPRHGLWNLKNEVVIREHNLGQGKYFNGWARERIVIPKGYVDKHENPDFAGWHRALQSPVEESLYTLDDHFIYNGYPASEVREAVYEPSLFRLTPPTDKATWKTFADQIRNYPNPQKPYYENVPVTRTLACTLKNVRFRNQHSYIKDKKRYVIGEVVNDTEEKAYLTKITAKFYSATGELAATVSQTTTALFLAELMPHESLPFKLELDNPSINPACFELSLAKIRIKNQQNYRDREGTYYIVGEIINESNEPIYFPKIKVELYDDNQQLLKTNPLTQTDKDVFLRKAEMVLNLDPEAKPDPLQIVPFKIVIPNPPATLTSYKLSLTWEKSNKNAHYRLVKPTEMKYRYNKGVEVFGKMQNELTGKIKNVKIAVTFYDKEGNVVETGAGTIDYLHEIAPKEIFTYTLKDLRKDLDMKKVHYVVYGEGDLITDTVETALEPEPEPPYLGCLARNPCDLQSWMADFPSKTLISTTGTISNIRTTKHGFRFLIDLQPGYYLENIRNASDLQLAKDLKPGTYVVEHTNEGFFTIEKFKPSTVWATIPYTNITINQYNPAFIKLIVQNKGLEDILGASVEISVTAPMPNGKSGWITRTVDLLAGKTVTVTLQWPPPIASLMWPPPDADTWKKLKGWMIDSTEVWKVTPQVYYHEGERLRFATSTVTVKPGPDAGSAAMIEATSSPLTKPLMFFVLVIFVGVAFSIFWKQWEMPLESSEANKAIKAIDSGDESTISMLYDSLEYDFVAEIAPVTQATEEDLVAQAEISLEADCAFHALLYNLHVPTEELAFEERFCAFSALLSVNQLPLTSLTESYCAFAATMHFVVADEQESESTFKS